MNSYSERVLYDRYSVKNPDAQLEVDDVVVLIKEEIDKYSGKKKDSRLVGIVRAVNGDVFDVALKHSADDDKDRKVITNVPRHLLEYVVEREYEPVCTRMSEGIVELEEEDNKEKFKAEVYQATRSMEFIPAGRILAGLGRSKSYDVTLFNCYVFAIPGDSRDGIGKHWLRLLNTYATGGGIGWDISVLRPRGSIVKKVHGRSSGAISWAEQFSQVTGAVEQGGSRRGASLQGLWCWHPDIEEFIEAKSLYEKAKTPEGEWIDVQGKALSNSNASVMISDDFMEAVQYDDDWDLVFPDTQHPDYDETWGGDLWQWKRDGKPVDVYKTVKARKLWDQIVHHAWKSGEPGLLFLERSNKMSNSYYYDRVVCTNPCVTADTPIFTDHGIFTVDELRENKFYAAQDKRLVEADAPTASNEAKAFFSTGIKPVYRLQTKEGYYLRCTGNHRVMTADGWKRADELEEEDVLHVHHSHHHFFNNDVGSAELGYVLGWLVADGHVTGEKAVLDFYDKKKDLAKLFAEKTLKIVAGTEKANRDYGISPVYVEKKDKYTFKSERLFRVIREYGVTAENIKAVPTIVRRGSEQTQKAFLSALFTADGTFNDAGDKGASVRLDSTSTELLEGAQLLLLNFGIASKIYWNRRDAGYRKLPDGKGGVQEYWCQANHTLAISKRNMVVFRDQIDFMLEYKRQALDAYLSRLTKGPYKETFTARFESLILEGEEEVFDTTVHYTHAYGSGGLISHNCGEQPLPKNAICNLGHVNLVKFIKDDAEQFPDKEITAEKADNLVDWEHMIEVIQLGVRFLDNCIDLNKYHDEESKAQQMKERRIGLGILGLGEMLMRLGLGYGTHEGLKFTESVFRFISTESYLASVELAKERGPFPAFDAEKFVQSGFMRNHLPKVIEAVRSHGIRNVTLNTVAPTGSVGTLADTTTGIEPYFALKWTATTRIGTTKEKMSALANIVDKFGEDKDDWPDYVVTAQSGITTSQHVKTQAIAQRWVDSSISKTVNLPKGSTVEDVSNAYIAMWRQGCKGGTVYVDQSRDEQVLHVEEDEKDIPVINGTSRLVKRKVLRPPLASGIGPTFSLKIPGNYSVHMTFRCDGVNGEPYDFFINAGKGELAANSQGHARLISMILRWPNNEYVPQKLRLDMIRDQLFKIPGRSQEGFGKDAIVSFPDAVAKAISKFLEGDYPMSSIPMGMTQLEEVVKTLSKYDIPSDVLDKLFMNGASENSPKQLVQIKDNVEDEEYEVEEDIEKSYHKDYCLRCGDPGWLEIPGECSKCTVCGYKEC